MSKRKFVKFTFVVGTERQRQKLIKFLNDKELVDDLLSSVDVTFLSTWRYPEKGSGTVLEVEFRTHTDDVNGMMNTILDYMGKSIKLGFAEPIKQTRIKKGIIPNCKKSVKLSKVRWKEIYI